ncbi:MAG TPA: hypothetical protein VEL74_06790 [Thermoanaerobaculia bacterium]|nr:hypothetical protein [Thermoanaerobaculia bacterium]
MRTETVIPRIDPAAFTAPAAVKRLQSLAVVVGGIAAVLWVIGAVMAPSYFLRSFLVGWVYWMGVSLGCLALSMLHHMTHGDWGIVLRRVMEAAARTLPLLAVLLAVFIGALYFIGWDHLYSWASPAAANDEILQKKEAYLNVPAWVLRQILYFAIWLGLAFTLSRMSLRQDRADDPGITRRMQVVAAPGLILYVLSVTFASVDWLMSLEPHWFSTIYGVYLVGSQGLAALAFLIAIAVFLSRREPMSQVLQPRHFHDWGKLLLAFVMLWAYFCFSQFLITWAGNLPEEIHWFEHRLHHGWQYVALALVLFHFALPFALLLSRPLKRNAGRLIMVATVMLIMRWVDLVFQTEPSFEEQSLAFGWMYLVAPLAIGGLWLFYFLRQLQGRPLLPVSDPFLPEAIAKEALAHE